MRKHFTLSILIFSFCIFANGQVTSSRLNEIRKMYQQTQNEKSTYITKERDITWEAFSGEDDSYSEATIKKHYSPNNKLKLITLSFFSSKQYSSYMRKVDLYYEMDSIYFLFSVRERSRWEDVYEQKGETTLVTEERAYFNFNGECIRYLIKEFEGKPEDIEALRMNTPNIEVDCIDVEELIQGVKKYLK